MACLSPVSVPIWKVEPQTAKIFRDVEGKINRFTERRLMKVRHYVNVPCGKCPACLARLQQQWAFRIEQEVLRPSVVSALFVTLTYAPKYLPSDFSVHKEDVQKYLKRLRTNLLRNFSPKCNLRYYACGEYGDLNNRPHYHLILAFNMSVPWKMIQSSWNMGIVDISPFTLARAGYVAKYSLKQFGLSYEGLRPPFRLCSKGLGSYFLVGRSARSLGYSNRFRNLSGRSVVLHRYYLDKLYPHYKREYVKIDSPFGVVRMSHRYDVSTSDRSNYLWKSEKVYNDYVRSQSLSNQYGYLGFVRDNSIGIYNSFLYNSFRLTEKQLLK